MPVHFRSFFLALQETIVILESQKNYGNCFVHSVLQVEWGDSFFVHNELYLHLYAPGDSDVYPSK